MLFYFFLYGRTTGIYSIILIAQKILNKQTTYSVPIMPRRSRRSKAISSKARKKNHTLRGVRLISAKFRRYRDGEFLWYSNHRILGIMPDDVGKKT